MVGFGSSLRLARRSGWERAYLDYETLKLLLSQIEAVYEEEGHRRNAHGNTNDAFMEFDNIHAAAGGGGGDSRSPRSNDNRRRGRRKGGASDYRDELFLESDSDLAYASSASDVLGGGRSSLASSDEDEEMGMNNQGGPGPSPVMGAPRKTNFTLTYSEELSSSEEGDDGGMDIGECAGGTLTRPWRRSDKNAVFKPPKAQKTKKKRGGRRDDASSFFVGDFILEGNDGGDAPAGDVESPDQPPYASSSLLSKSFQRGTYGTEQTGLLQPAQSSQTASFYSFSRPDALTPPRPNANFAGTQQAASWATLGTNVNALRTAQQQQPESLTRKPLTSAEIRRNKREAERRKKRRQRRRRRLAKRRKQLEQRVPRHLRIAHKKARAITERFLGLLRAEVEKVTLFAQSRLGELADTAGSLRFPSYDESEYGSFSSQGGPPGRAGGQYEVLSDGGMHPSASSSEDERMGGGALPWSDTSDDDENSEGGSKNALSPTSRNPRTLRKSYSAGAMSSSTERQTNLSSPQLKRRNEKQRASGRKAERDKGHRPANEKNDKSEVAQRQISHFEELRRNRPSFQRHDHIVGEDLLLLSAVDEADGYTAVGVELMHVLRFICVNVIAVRKICRKHDRLLGNRMLGGYYHRQLRDGSDGWRVGGGTDKSQTSITLGSIVARPVGSDDCSGLVSSTDQSKLVGVYDTKLQQLANSTTVQVISSCLSLALSEYEVSQSRADALARLNSASDPAMTPLASGGIAGGDSRSLPQVPLSTVPSGLSPRWLSKVRDEESHVRRDDSSYEASLDEHGDGPPSTSNVSLTRLRFTVVSVFALREASRVKQDAHATFLSRSFLAFNGPNVLGEGLNGCSRETLDFFVAYNPDAALLLDSSALYRGLREGHWRRIPIGSVMLASLATAIRAADIPPSAEYECLRDDSYFAMNALSILPDSEGQAGSCVTGKRNHVQRGITQTGGFGIIHSTTLSLNRMSLFLYTMNYYIILPSANSFVLSTGAHAAHSATLIGAASFSAIFSASYHCYLLSKAAAGNKWYQYSIPFFRRPLLLASMFPIIGNVLYAVAEHRGSIPMAVGGRLFIGLGSAELLNRLMLAHCLPAVHVVAESSRLVKWNVGGLISGLLLGAVFATFDVQVDLSGQRIFVHSRQLSSILLSILWFVQFVRLLFYFQEPSEDTTLDNNLMEDSIKSVHNNGLNDSTSDSSMSGPMSGTPDSFYYHSSSDVSHNELTATYGAKSGTSETLPTQSEVDSDEKKNVKHTPSRETQGMRRRRWATILSRTQKVLAYNVALPVTFALVFLAKMEHEILFSSCPLITDRYFEWNGEFAGLFLGALSVLILPINYVCGTISRSYEERTVIKRSVFLTGFGLVLMLNWSSLFSLFRHVKSLLSENESSKTHHYDWKIGVYQYIFGFITTFVGVIAVEGTTLSLMSKVAPLNLRGVVLNCATIVTFLGHFARVTGDIDILMVGLSHRLINTDIVNSLVIPLIVACAVAGYIVKKHFFFLM